MASYHGHWQLSVPTVKYKDTHVLRFSCNFHITNDNIKQKPSSSAGSRLTGQRFHSPYKIWNLIPVFARKKSIFPIQTKLKIIAFFKIILILSLYSYLCLKICFFSNFPNKFVYHSFSKYYASLTLLLFLLSLWHKSVAKPCVSTIKAVLWLLRNSSQISQHCSRILSSTRRT